jgi:Domain of unknown function (DUF1918)
MTGGRRLRLPNREEGHMPAKTNPGGLIVEILGAPGHEHYRVRWIDDHESIYYPADGAVSAPPDHEMARH